MLSLAYTIGVLGHGTPALRPVHYVEGRPEAMVESVGEL
jgi:hypothetical protein